MPQRDFFISQRPPAGETPDSLLTSKRALKFYSKQQQRILTVVSQDVWVFCSQASPRAAERPGDCREGGEPGETGQRSTDPPHGKSRVPLFSNPTSFNILVSTLKRQKQRFCRWADAWRHQRVGAALTGLAPTRAGAKGAGPQGAGPQALAHCCSMRCLISFSSGTTGFPSYS